MKMSLAVEAAYWNASFSKVTKCEDIETMETEDWGERSSEQ